MEIHHDPNTPDTVRDAAQKPEPETIEARRARRMNALRKIAGIWKDRPDIPADALDYGRETRDEWRS